MSNSFWSPQLWRPGALAPLTPLATPLPKIQTSEVNQ